MNYYSNGYPQMPQQYYQQNGQSYQQQGYSQANVENTFAWVYSDAGAEAYPVAPGKTVLLMHYNEPILYLKSTDMNGRPLPMETYDLVKRSSSQAPNGYYSQTPQLPQQPNMSEYVKKSELEGQVNEIMSRNMTRNMGTNVNDNLANVTMNNGGMNPGNMSGGQRANMPPQQGWGPEVQ